MSGITEKSYGRLQKRAQHVDAALNLKNHADGSIDLILTRGSLVRDFKTTPSGIVSLERLLAEIEAEAA